MKSILKWWRVLAAGILAIGLQGCSADLPTAPIGETGDQGANPVFGEVNGTLRGDLPGRYIVQLRPGKGAAASAAQALAVRHGFALGVTYETALRGFAAGMTADAAAALAADPQVLTVEPDKRMTVAGQTIPTGVDRIDAERNGFAAIDGAPNLVDVDIAIIDTGIDSGHPDLNVAGGVGILGGVVSPDFADVYRHGTHVAGIAAARDDGQGVVGVAPGARLWGVKVLNDAGLGSLSDIIAGLDWVAARAGGIEVVNMSLAGLGWSDAYRAAVLGCVNAGVVVVAAAGNDAVDIFGPNGTLGDHDDIVPAAIPEVMTISALADSDGLPGGFGGATSAGPDDSCADFSNYSRSADPANPVISPGAAIDLMLPGVDILSTVPGGGYQSLSGTSLASPHAAGLAALYIAEHGRPTNAAGVFALRQALIDRAAPQAGRWGLDTADDPDANHEPIGFAAVLDDFLDVGFLSFEAPAAVYQGQTVFTRVRIGNRGTLPVTDPVTVRMFEAATGRDVIVPRTIPDGIPVGVTITGLAHFFTNTSIPPGRYTLVVEHNLADAVSSNDRMTAEVELLPALEGVQPARE